MVQKTSSSDDKPEPPRLMLSDSTLESSAESIALKEGGLFDGTKDSGLADAASQSRTISVDSSFSSSSSASEEESSLVTAADAGAAEKNSTTVMRLKGYESSPTRAERWMQRAWIVHFVIGAIVLVYSVFLGNGGRSKYIVVDPSHAADTRKFSNCEKLFINVLADTESDDGAIVCCGSHHESKTLVSELLGLCPPSRDSTQQSYPAASFASSLPLLGRLAKFPDAWLIPLFPLILRIGFRTYQTILERGHIVLDTTFGVFSFRRLVFYFLLMQFRGWILYVALNNLEDNYIVGSNDTNTEGGPSSTCWYKSWLPARGQQSSSQCRGRVFDFSDHVVLYYAQILPIALLEYLHSMNRPYWPFHFFRRIALPFLLTSGMLYLYFITFVGVYKTCSYFHTPQESLAGYAVSLVSHLPLCTLQCSNITAVAHLREYFFGPKKSTKKLSPRSI